MYIWRVSVQAHSKQLTSESGQSVGKDNKYTYLDPQLIQSAYEQLSFASSEERIKASVFTSTHSSVCDVQGASWTVTPFSSLWLT